MLLISTHMIRLAVNITHLCKRSLCLPRAQAKTGHYLLIPWSPLSSLKSIWNPTPHQLSAFLDPVSSPLKDHSNFLTHAFSTYQLWLTQGSWNQLRWVMQLHHLKSEVDEKTGSRQTKEKVSTVSWDLVHVCVRICVRSGQQVQMNFVCHNVLRNTFLIGLAWSLGLWRFWITGFLLTFQKGFGTLHPPDDFYSSLLKPSTSLERKRGLIK